MKITFQTKEESNRAQREAFLKLSPEERMKAFFALSRRMLRFPVKEGMERKIPEENFLIEKKRG